MTGRRLTAATPVIVGVGEVIQRPGDGTDLDPIALAAEAGRRAAEDANAPGLLAVLDAVDVVNIVSWSYADPARALATALGARPTRAVHSDVGGHQPVALLDAAAARIASGESEVALVAGGEAVRTLEAALRTGAMPPWPAPPADARPVDPRDHAAGAMADFGLCLPTEVYPLYEQASRAAVGLTQTEARQHAARRWAAYATIASGNPTAWIREAPDAHTIATIGAKNRLVAWPYPKLMNALLSVDQAGAVLLTSAERARALGVPEDRWVFPLGGASAAEPDDVLARATFERSTAGAVALDRALALSDRSIDEIDLVELYSCFPCVPRMAARHLGLADDATTTVTGGLTFFGGPANNYMTHAVAAMVRQLRDGRDQLGLLYGQGGYATKHHALLLSVTRPEAYLVDDRAAAQRIVDDEPKPDFDPSYAGSGVIETFTMPWGRDGEPARIVVVGRSPDGTRFAGEMPVEPEVVAALTSPTEEPIGLPVVAANDNGRTTVTLA